MTMTPELRQKLAANLVKARAAKANGRAKRPYGRRASTTRPMPSLATLLRAQARRLKLEALALQRRAHALLAAARLVGRG